MPNKEVQQELINCIKDGGWEAVIAQLDYSNSVAVKILNSIIEDGLIEKFGEARVAAYRINRDEQNSFK